MLKTPAFVTISQRLVRLLQGPWWMAPGILLLSVLTFLSEGAGIYMLIPLITTVLARQGIETTTVVGEGGRLFAMLDWIADLFAGPYQIAMLLGLVILFIFLRGVFWLASKAAFSYVAGRIGYLVRMRALDRLLNAPQSFVDAQPPGRLLNILSLTATELSDGMNRLSGLVLNGAATVTFMAMMLFVSVELTVVVGGAMMLILGLVYVITSRSRRMGKDFARHNTALAARISETLGGLRMIVAFNRDAEEKQRFGVACKRVWMNRFKLDMLQALPQPVIMFLSASFIAGLVVTSGGETLVSLLVFLIMLQRMQLPASRFMQFRSGILGLSGALDLVDDFMADPEATPLPSGPEAAPPPRRTIRLENVRYRYARGDRDAVNGLTFDIPAGKTTALVGHSGAGKSTVISLVCRHFDPHEGAVLVDGEPLTAFDLRSWRRRIAIVPQDVFLFDETIRENVAFGRPDATDAEIAEALVIAGADEFVAQLPQGLATRLGDRGSQFSGGQRQRIALARAIIANPDLLILDEATNALDNLSARLVQDAIQRASVGRTVLVVAHRLAPVLDADHVVVLDKGRAVEEGSPAALLKAGGPFSRLVAAEGVAA